MFQTQTDNVFGICQLGEWSAFSHSNIQSYNKRIIDFSAPFPLWLPTLTELSNIFIVSRFASPEDITNTLDFIKICRNNLIFINIVKNSVRIVKIFSYVKNIELSNNACLEILSDIPQFIV